MLRQALLEDVDLLLDMAVDQDLNSTHIIDNSLKGTLDEPVQVCVFYLQSVPPASPCHETRPLSPLSSLCMHALFTEHALKSTSLEKQNCLISKLELQKDTVISGQLSRTLMSMTSSSAEGESQAYTGCPLSSKRCLTRYGKCTWADLQNPQMLARQCTCSVLVTQARALAPHVSGQMLRRSKAQCQTLS